MDHQCLHMLEDFYSPTVFRHPLERSLLLGILIKIKMFTVTGHISSEIIFLTCASFSNIYYKIKFVAENWSDLMQFL